MDSYDARLTVQPHFQPSVSPASHQYACLRCRSRRVKCDKILTGCAPCASHGAQCVYSTRRPRKSNRTSQPQQKGKRSLLPALEKSSILPTAEPALDNELRASACNASDDEDTIVLRELREGLYEASKDRDGGIVVGPPGDAEIIGRVGGEKVRVCLFLFSRHGCQSNGIAKASGMDRLV
jgi:hypothetical protein